MWDKLSRVLIDEDRKEDIVNLVNLQLEGDNPSSLVSANHENIFKDPKY